MTIMMRTFEATYRVASSLVADKYQFKATSPKTAETEFENLMDVAEIEEPYVILRIKEVK